LSWRALILLIATLASVCVSIAEDKAPTNGSFPTVSEVLQGRSFANNTERDIFFLRAIHDRYNSHWPALLEANITEQDYLLAPVKLQRFIDEVGAAMRDTDDSVAITNLASLTSDTKFFTDINSYNPEVLNAAAQALMLIGPNGRKALADTFNEGHYRADPAGLEQLAKTIGEDRPSDPALAGALAATAFDFSTTNGGIYPRCTTEMVKNLLLLPDGVSEVRAHLKTDPVFANPVRFQSVVDGIAAARATDLATNLTVLNGSIEAKLATLKNHPSDYHDALDYLHDRIREALELFGKPKKSSN
jgi:hypothetical protein